MRNEFIFTILLCVLFWSCRKDSKIEKINFYCECCDLKNSPNQLIFGDTADMWVFPLSNIISFDYSQLDTSKFDLEGDSIIDIKIISGKFSYFGSSIFYNHATLSLLEDSVYLNYESNVDSIFYYDTLYYILQDTVTHTIQEKYYTCFHYTENDSFYETQIISYAKHHFEGETLNKNTQWTNDPTVIHSTYRGFFEEGTLTATNHIYNYTFQSECHNIESAQLYLGIRKFNCGKEKLGWIKIELEDSLIIVKEIALQK